MCDIRIFSVHSIFKIMRKTFLSVWIALFMVITGGVTAQVFTPADGSKVEQTQEYFQGELTDFQVSASGKGVAYLRYETNRWVLYWDNINGGRETRVSKPEEANVVDYRWVGDDAIVYATGEGKIGSELHRCETFTKTYNRLTSTPVLIKFLDSHHYNNGTTLLIRSASDAASTKVYSILPGMRELKHISSGTGVNWVEGLGTGATFFIEKTEEGVRFVNGSPEGGAKLGMVKGLCDIQGLALAGKSKEEVYALSDINRSTSALVKMNMRDAVETDVVFERNSCVVSKVLFSSTKSTPLVVWYVGAERGFEVVDEGFRSTVSAMTEKLPTLYGFDITHSDLSENVWILSVLNPGGARVYYHYNVSNRELKQFGKQQITREPVAPVTDFLQTDDNDKIMVRYYSPAEVNTKSLGVLVFRDSPWQPAGEGAMDVLIQNLLQQGLVVAEIDLAYSESSRKKLIHAGYDQLVDRVMNQIPMIQKSMMSNFGLSQNVLAVIGEGIGSRAALRITAANTATVLRSVLINAAPELSSYMSAQFPVELGTQDFVLGYNGGAQVMSLSYIAREPLFVYSSSKEASYKSLIEPSIQKFTREGRSPESYMVGAGFDEHFSAGIVQAMGSKIADYVRK